MKFSATVPVLSICALALTSCFRTDFSTSTHKAKISGKTAAIHTWYFAGEKHAAIHKIDGTPVKGNRTFTVDAGRRTLETAFVGFGFPQIYTGGTAILTPILLEGHTYQVTSGTSENRDMVYVRDITGGKKEVIASASIKKSF